MILNCPNCATRYVVPDNAISASGRQVRCANCKHSWFQEGKPIKIDDIPPPPINIAPQPVPTENRPIQDNVPRNASTIASTTDMPTAEKQNISNPSHNSGASSNNGMDVNDNIDTNTSNIERAKADYKDSNNKQNISINDANKSSASDSIGIDHKNYSSEARADGHIDPAVSPANPFGHEPPFQPRRNPAKIWTIAALSFALCVAIIAAALWYSGALSGSMSRATVSSELEITTNDSEINETQDGRRFFIVSGTIINPTNKEITVPDMIGILLSSDDRELYTWEITAPVEKLGPGARVEFSGAARDNVPRSAASVAVDWKGSR